MVDAALLPTSCS